MSVPGLAVGSPIYVDALGTPCGSWIGFLYFINVVLQHLNVCVSPRQFLIRSGNDIPTLRKVGLVITMVLFLFFGFFDGEVSMGGIGVEGMLCPT